MKMNFAISFKYFMTGGLVSISLVMFLLSLPSLGDAVLGSAMNSDESEFAPLMLILFLLFFSYGIGMAIEMLSSPFPKSSYLEEQMGKYQKRLDKKNFIIQKSKICSVEELYRYMVSTVRIKNENLSREIDGSLFKVYAMTSLSIVSFFLFLSFIMCIISEGSPYSSFIETLGEASWIDYSVLCLLLSTSILFFLMRRKNKKDLIDEIERSYEILTKFTVTNGKGTQDNDEKVEIEMNL